MNTEPNEPEFAAALETLRAKAAARYKIVFNEAVLDYAKKEYRNIRTRNPALSPEEAVFAALDKFPAASEGADYCDYLVEVFFERYRMFVGRRLRWACGEGFIPARSVPMVHSIIADVRISCIRGGKCPFDLGNPRIANPQTVAEQALAQARQDVDGNLDELSQLTSVFGGGQ